MASNDKQDDKQDGKQKSKQAKQWTPPRGIRFFEDHSRPQPFFLQWRVPDEKRPGFKRRETKSFKTREHREIVARDLAFKVEKHGVAVMDFDPARWLRYLEFQKIVGEDTDPILVGHEWLASRQGIGTAGATAITVRDAWTKYRALRFGVEKLSPDTWRHIDKHVGERFCATFGSLLLSEITADHVRDWMSKLVSSRTGKPIEAVTRRHHRKDVATFFDRCWREGWIARNPCDLVAVPAVEENDVIVISPADALAFFTANRDARVIGRIALEAFGGLRYSSAAKIQKEHLNFAEQGIEMPGSSHKSGKRKYRQGHPDVLWQWLNHAPETCWTMTPLQYREEKRAAFVRAKLRPVGLENDEDRETVRGLRNVWRHSFASYMLAKTKSIATVGYLMQHTNPATTQIYEGRASEKDAEAYLAITPAACVAK